jgi:hypothetical protein
MKDQKIATLSFFINPTSRNSSLTRQVGPQEYQTVINGGMIANDGTDFTIRTQKDFQTVAAHELGHFLALISKDPTHSREALRHHQTMFGELASIPAEKRAWELAHLIYPNLDRGNETKSLKTYDGEDPWKSLVKSLV